MSTGAYGGNLQTLSFQVIANTAGFHMPTIEQGGNSLYPSMAQRASSVEVLRILLSIGPTEIMHFQTWSDKAGNAVPRQNFYPHGIGPRVTSLHSPHGCRSAGAIGI